MSFIEDLKKLLEKSKGKKSEFIDQLLKEKELTDKLRSMGLTVTSLDATERARERPLGILSVVEKVNTVDELKDIKTADSDNVFIDLLKKGAYLENRRTIINQGTTPTSWGDGVGDLRRGKFFSHGCMGFLEKIAIYCKDAGSGGGTITVYISPHPSMGYIAKADITVPASAPAETRFAIFNRMWLYDTLFIYVVCSSSQIVWGHDSIEPIDSWESTDGGATWLKKSFRPYFSAVMQGQNVCVLPIGGIVNTINVPSLVSARQLQQLDVPADDSLYDTLQVGSGHTLIVIYFTDDEVAVTKLKPRLRLDGNEVLPLDIEMSSWQVGFINENTKGISIGKWTPTDYYSIVVTIQFPFSYSLEVGFFNTDVSTRTGYVGYAYKKIR